MRYVSPAPAWRSDREEALARPAPNSVGPGRRNQELDLISEGAIFPALY